MSTPAAPAAAPAAAPTALPRTASRPEDQLPPLLAALLATASPSGFEAPAAAVWRDAARAFAEVTVDAAGNSFATVRPEPRAGSGRPQRPTVLLAGHLDEIGVICSHVDDKGFVFIQPVGGWDAQVLVGQRIRFQGPEGPVVGVVGKKAIHLQTTTEREKVSRFADLWVDLGTTSKAETLALVRVGDAGVLEQPPLVLRNGRLVGRGLDDRVGAYVVLEALRRYAADPGEATVVAAGTVQEEIGLRGARVAAERIRPTCAIAVDVTHAIDTPGTGTEVRERGSCELGSGPSVAVGAVLSPVLGRLMAEAAAEKRIPTTPRAYGGTTSTDADAISLAAAGVPIALVGLPNRYMHSPSEMVSLEDLDRAAELLAETCRRVTAATDFTAR